VGSPTLICPFCRDTDFDDTGLKVHLTEGYCEVFNAVTGPARTARLTPTPPAPADDASGAEAMRERAAKQVAIHADMMQESDAEGAAYSTDGVVRKLRRLAETIRALPLPGDDAVEEASRG
jgi:hypothetical protein